MPMGCWWWTETGFLKPRALARLRRGRSVSTAARRVGENCQSGYSWPACGKLTGPCWTGRTVPAPGVGRGCRNAPPEAGVPRRSLSFRPQALNWRKGCWSTGAGISSPASAGFRPQVYGSDRNLRLWLEQEGISHVLAIKSNEKLWALTPPKGPQQVRADRLAAQVEE